jgi:hypothetical protein
MNISPTYTFTLLSNTPVLRTIWTLYALPMLWHPRLADSPSGSYVLNIVQDSYKRY